VGGLRPAPAGVIGSALWWAFGHRFRHGRHDYRLAALQAKGTGRRLMRWLFDQAGARVLQLNATPAGLRLYRSEGFREIGRIHQHQGPVQSLPVVAALGRVRPIAAGDWPRIRALDLEAYGAERSAALDGLAAVRSDMATRRANGELAGFSLLPPVSAAAMSSADRRTGRGRRHRPAAAASGGAYRPLPASGYAG